MRPGSYRIRIAGKGADSAEADLPADEWLLQFWPASEIVDPIRIVRPPGY